MKIGHLVYETLPHLNMKFHLNFAYFCGTSFICKVFFFPPNFSFVFWKREFWRGEKYFAKKVIRFLCVGLNVLVSFFLFYKNFQKSSLTHSKFYIQMSKIKIKLHVSVWNSFIHHMHYLYTFLSMTKNNKFPSITLCFLIS